MTSWGVADAKANFSAVLDKAEFEGPQLLKRRKQRFLLLTEEALTHLTGPLQALPQPGNQNAWAALRPPVEDLVDDIDFPRLSGSIEPPEF